MINRIRLKDFRNYDDLNLDFESSRNIFVGKNGQGKSNLLEAIFFLSVLRSFRTTQIRDLKKINTKGFHLGIGIQNESWTKFLEVEYFKNRKLIIDGNPVHKSSEFIREFKAVAFIPDDILIIQGNSGLRRRFIDILISTVYPEYLTALHNYMTALQSRNILLRNGHPDNNLIIAYEEILAANSVTIVNYRQKISMLLSKEISKLLNLIKKEDINFNINYRFQSGIEDQTTFKQRFEEERDKDLQRGYTSLGPQLDDFDFMYNGKLLRNFGSTGQCRLTALCLKMAKLNIFYGNDSQNNIIALVDDVTGELDAQTKNSFFEVIDRAEQSFFTFTENPEENYFNDADIYKVENGTVIK